MLHRLACTFSTALYLAAALAIASAARADADEARALRDAAVKITATSRQGMLIEGMTKSACFAMAGIAPERHVSDALESLDSYGTVLDALTNGHEWLGILPETDATLIAEVRDAAQTWMAYRPAIEQIVNGDLHTVVMAQILNRSGEVVARSDAVARRFRAHYGPRVFSADLTAALDLAGRQRMLTQRIARQFCFALFGLGRADTRTELARDIAEFDANFDRLAHGDGPVAAAPNAAIKRNLRTARLFWTKQRDTYQAVADGRDVDSAQIRQVVKLSPSVLKQLNQAVEAYIPRQY